MQLYRHQSESLKKTENLNHVAYYHDMGLGKTFTGAEKMKELGAKVNLLVCQKSKIKDWVEHFTKHGFENLMPHDGSPISMIYDCSKWDKADWKDFAKSPDEPCIMVINYELAWRRKELLKLKDFTLMLDESSLIQNKTAKQTKFILKLCPLNVILLSGTPTAGKYENLWTQIHLLGWGISDNLYQSQYVNWTNLEIGHGMNSRIIRVVDKKNPYKNVERLKEKLREHGADFLKTEDVMTLPEQTFVEVNVSTSKEYHKFMKDCIITIDTLNLCEFHDDSDFYGNDITPRIELVGDTSLTKRLYARQLCGQYNAEKLRAFRDLAQSTNDRLIVFYNFNAELEQLIGMCEKLNKPVSQVNGFTKDLGAYEREENSVTLCQYQAAAMGLNLQKANKIIYYSLPERCELWMQSQKRIHRIGQEKPCFYYVMMCAGTVEEQIYNALKRGVDFTDELFREVE